MSNLLRKAIAALWLLASIANAGEDDAARLREQILSSGEAFGIVESLTTEVGARPAGSEADARVVAWARAKFRELGYDKVYVEPVTFPVWQRVAEHALVTAPAPQRLAVTALGGSIGTGGALQAQLVQFNDLAELQAAPQEQVRGKIVLLSKRMERRLDGSGYASVLPMRSNAASIAARKGALALLIRSLGTDNDRLPHTGSVIYEGGAAIPAAAVSNPDADLLQRLLQRGAPVSLQLDIAVATQASYTSYNVIGEITGADAKEEIVMLAAHLDSWDLGTGAIDDGFGVAVVMAAGAAIGKMPARPRRTIRVALFANEENGFHGAKAYAARDVADLARHRMAIESDWGGGRIYALRQPPGDKGLAARLAEALAPLEIIPDSTPGAPGPDVGFLARRGVPWAQLAQDASCLFDYHHGANDTLDKIDPAALKQNAAAYAIFAWINANAR